jgi:hypothetical protein
MPAANKRHEGLQRRLLFATINVAFIAIATQSSYAEGHEIVGFSRAESLICGTPLCWDFTMVSERRDILKTRNIINY